MLKNCVHVVLDYRYLIILINPNMIRMIIFRFNLLTLTHITRENLIIQIV